MGLPIVVDSDLGSIFPFHIWLFKTSLSEIKRSSIRTASACLRTWESLQTVPQAYCSDLSLCAVLEDKDYPLTQCLLSSTCCRRSSNLCVFVPPPPSPLCPTSSLAAGYPDHMVFSEFRRRFDVLAPHLTKKHGRHYIVTDEKRVSVRAVSHCWYDENTCGCCRGTLLDISGKSEGWTEPRLWSMWLQKQLKC